MDASILAALVVASLAALVQVLRHLRVRNQPSQKQQRLPPGSFGLPIVGQTLGLLGAFRTNTGEEWLRRWASVYGPVSRLSVFGCPTAFLVGPSSNKFIFSSPAITAKSTVAFKRLIGRRTVRDVSGADHRRLRAMMVQFLKLDSVKSYVGVVDGEVRHHLRTSWLGHTTVAVMPAMKSLTFDIMCAVIFGLGKETHAAVRRQLSADFLQLVSGLWAIPVDLPFTPYRKSLAASRRARRAIASIVEEKRAKIFGHGESSPSPPPPAGDLLTHMLAEGLPYEDIIDNGMFMMVAARDTGAILITFLVRHLENNKDAYAKVVAEQDEIARSKAPGEALTWEDLGRMRYTWSAAMETLRLVPPVFVPLRRTVDDVEFNGYLIPKGWQVLQATNMTQWDPDVFPDPGRFEPARFEDPSAIPPFTFVPFGGGPRMCPGNEFARVETLVAMHYIVTGFKWKLAAGCDGSFSRYPLPSPTQGLLLDIEPRETTTPCGVVTQ